MSSPGFFSTAVWNELTLPSGTSSLQASTTEVAPYSMNRSAIFSAAAIYSARLSHGTGITVPLLRPGAANVSPSRCANPPKIIRMPSNGISKRGPPRSGSGITAASRGARALARRFDTALTPFGISHGQYSLMMSFNRPDAPRLGDTLAAPNSAASPPFIDVD